MGTDLLHNMALRYFPEVKRKSRGYQLDAFFGDISKLDECLKEYIRTTNENIQLDCLDEIMSHRDLEKIENLGNFANIAGYLNHSFLFINHHDDINIIHVYDHTEWVRSRVVELFYRELQELIPHSANLIKINRIPSKKEWVFQVEANGNEKAVFDCLHNMFDIIDIEIDTLNITGIFSGPRLFDDEYTIIFPHENTIHLREIVTLLGSVCENTELDRILRESLREKIKKNYQNLQGEPEPAPQSSTEEARLPSH